MRQRRRESFLNAFRESWRKKEYLCRSVTDSHTQRFLVGERISIRMDTPFAATSPSRLYALLLRLRPLQSGTLMAFSGELVHGALLRWLSASAPEVATWLHDGNKRRLFTCSSLQFPFAPARIPQPEPDNVPLPPHPHNTFTHS